MNTTIIPLPNNESITNIMYETRAMCENMYKDVCVEQYRIMYPALKYGDVDMLEESLHIIRNSVQRFFNHYANSIDKQFKTALSQVSGLHSEFEHMADTARKQGGSMEGSIIESLTVYTYRDDLPQIKPLEEACVDIKRDQRVFSGDTEDMVNLVKGLDSYIKRVKCKMFNTTDAPSDVNLFMYNKLRNDGVTERTLINDEYFKSMHSDIGKFSSYIKDVHRIVDRYVYNIKRVSHMFNNNNIYFNVVDSDIMLTLEHTDPENMFYRYEIVKLCNIFDAMNTALFAKITMIDEALAFKNEMLRQYLSDDDNISIPDRI